MFYQLIRGSTDQTNKYDTFYLQQKIVDGWTYADIKVNHPLDYERIKEYNLTVRVEVINKKIRSNSLQSEINFHCKQLSNRYLIFNIQQNNGAQQLASEATVFIVLEDVNDEIPLFTEREQERVLEGEPVGTIVTRVNAIDRDGTFPNNQVNMKYVGN